MLYRCFALLLAVLSSVAAAIPSEDFLPSRREAHSYCSLAIPSTSAGDDTFIRVGASVVQIREDLRNVDRYDSYVARTSVFLGVPDEVSEKMRRAFGATMVRLGRYYSFDSKREVMSMGGEEYQGFTLFGGLRSMYDWVLMSDAGLDLHLTKESLVYGYNFRVEESEVVKFRRCVEDLRALDDVEIDDMLEDIPFGLSEFDRDMD